MGKPDFKPESMNSIRHRIMKYSNINKMDPDLTDLFSGMVIDGIEEDMNMESSDEISDLRRSLMDSAMVDSILRR